MSFQVFNKTAIPTTVLEDAVRECTKVEEGQFCGHLPDFYVHAINKEIDGMAITNVDRPFIIVIFESMEQFKRVVRHELVHLMQHEKGYADEKEAYEKDGAARYTFCGEKPQIVRGVYFQAKAASPSKKPR